MRHLAVIFGGTSVEHDISILTGIQALAIAKSLDYKVVPIYVRKGVWYTGDALYSVDFFKQFDKSKLTPVCLVNGTLYRTTGLKRAIAKIDVALLATHGGEGENGELQGLLAINGIPVCSTGTEGSSVTANKLYATMLAEHLEIDVPPYMSVKRSEHPSAKLLSRITKRLGDRVIVKPTHLGSSIGITISDSEEELAKGLELAFCYDTDVLCMECLPLDYELNVALFSYKGSIEVSAIEKPLKSQRMLTFDDKYLSQGSKGMESMSRELPAIIPIDLANRVRRWAKKLYSELSLSGIVRIDFLVSRGYLYFNEINTIPGSLALYLFRDRSPEDLLRMQIEDALYRREQDSITREFSSSVLSSTSFSKS